MTLDESGEDERRKKKMNKTSQVVETCMIVGLWLQTSQF